MQDTAAPILQAIIPLEAVPERLRLAVSRLVGEWGYSWANITFAGTARVSRSGWQAGDQEQWVFAISAAPVALGDEIVSGSGRAAGLSVGRFASGVIPATPYQAYVYERLGGRGRGPAPERQPPPQPSTTEDTEPAARDLRR
jgi:hypothetical protein